MDGGKETKREPFAPLPPLDNQKLYYHHDNPYYKTSLHPFLATADNAFWQNPLPEGSTTRCWYCFGRPIIPYPLPLERRQDGSWETRGVYCSLCCVKATILFEERGQNFGQLLNNLTDLAEEVYQYRGHIPVYHKNLFKHFDGGALDHTEFLRNLQHHGTLPILQVGHLRAAPFVQAPLVLEQEFREERAKPAALVLAARVKQKKTSSDTNEHDAHVNPQTLPVLPRPKAPGGARLATVSVETSADSVLTSAPPILAALPSPAMPAAASTPSTTAADSAAAGPAFAHVAARAPTARAKVKAKRKVMPALIHLPAVAKKTTSSGAQSAKPTAPRPAAPTAVDPNVAKQLLPSKPNQPSTAPAPVPAALLQTPTPLPPTKPDPAGPGAAADRLQHLRSLMDLSPDS